MVIGISGKKGHGKDLIGRIIQYHISMKRIESGELKTALYSRFESVINGGEYILKEESGWQVKKFADKLKDMVCLLINCTREQLEDRDFKEKELGEEWWYYKIYMGSTFTLKPFDGTYPNALLVKLTPRLLLQLLGTDCGREIIHPNIWVNATMAEYKPYQKPKAHNGENFSELYSHKNCQGCGKPYSGYKRQNLCKECIEDDSLQFYPSWLITDVRFPNEAKAIKDRDGLLIRVNRIFPLMSSYKDRDGSVVLTGVNENFKIDIHPSETALDNYDGFDEIITNNGSIEDLTEKVKTILLKHKII